MYLNKVTEIYNPYKLTHFHEIFWRWMFMCHQDLNYEVPFFQNMC